MKRRTSETLLVLAVSAIVLCHSTTGTFANPTTLIIASDDTWEVYNADPANVPSATLLGTAQKVCLNASTPPACPLDATLYGSPYFAPAWSADLSSIAGATWVWASGIDGSTSPADLDQFFFSRQYSIPGTPIGGSISVAVDDFAEVFVNGSPVGAHGSTTDNVSAAAAQQTLRTFDISPHLVSGVNIVTIHGQNGPASFAGCSGPCSYADNPAGVVFGGLISFEPLESVQIDIKPGSDTNTINLSSAGVIPVAILSSDTFDAAQVEPESISLAGARVKMVGKSNRLLCHVEDVNADGLQDLVCKVETAEFMIEPGSSVAVLEGETIDGTQIRGEDSVTIVAD